MNIFATHTCPHQSADFLDDKRVNKMISESGQMLTCIMREAGVVMPEHMMMGYPNSVAGHKCTNWLRESSGNVRWLAEHLESLLGNYDRSTMYRNVRTAHIKARYLMREAFRFTQLSEPMTPFVRAFSLDAVGAGGVRFLHSLPCPHHAYRTYLRLRWDGDKKPPTWKNRKDPR